MKNRKAGRKTVPDNPIRAERIEQFMQREGLNQDGLASALGTHQQNISRVLKSQKISESFISRIVEAYPDYREEWFFGYEEIPTHSEMHSIENKAISINAPITVLYDALHEVCTREKIDIPEFDKISDLYLMEAQLKDYAVFLMWNYVRYRKESCLWSYLDQIEEKWKV